MRKESAKGSRWPSSVPVWIALVTVGSAWATDPPDSKVNPNNNQIETVDEVTSSGNANVRLVETPSGGGYPNVTVLTTDSADDKGPRIAISSGGATSIVWWRDGATDEVFIKQRSAPGQSFGSETRMSESGESSRSPRVVHVGSHLVVAYLFDQSGGGLAIAAIDDEDIPFPSRTVVGNSTYGGDLDLLLTSESGSIWLTWIDSSTHVAWSEYNTSTQTWSSVQSESYASDSVAAARGRIRTTVLSN